MPVPKYHENRSVNSCALEITDIGAAEDGIFTGSLNQTGCGETRLGDL
jgi:hypothetical protein